MKKIIPALLAVLIGFTSCEDAIEQEPRSQKAGEDYFQNANELELFTNPLYNNIPVKEIWSEQSDVLVCQNLSALMFGGNRRTIPASGGGWSWTNLRRINTACAWGAKNCPDEAAVTKYTAVARFFRAMFYFQKVQRFGDVPWIDHEIGSADADLYNPRDSREVVMQHMIEDIDYAIDNLPAKKDESNAPFRVTKGAALALKAQFCLYEGTWRKYHKPLYEGQYGDSDYKTYLNLAAAAAKQLMDRNEYKLFTTGNPNADYHDLFVKDVADPNEYIFAISFQQAISGNRHNATGFTMTTTQGMPGFTRKFINTYLMADGSRFTDKNGWQTMQFQEEIAGRDPRLQQSIRGKNYTRIGQTEVLPPDFTITITGYQPIKYVENPKNDGGQVDRSDRSTVDLPIFRYAEVLLIYAEAKAEADNLNQNDLDISVNLIRQRAGMPNLIMASANANPDPYLASAETGYPNVSGSNKGVILEIRRERTIELVQENQRISDLFRWGCGKCLDQAITGMYFPGPGQYDLSGNGVVDYVLYANGGVNPAVPNDKAITKELERELYLTDRTQGYVDYHRGSNQVRNGFNEERDYLYPIPSDEIAINKNLTQNPGWR